MAKSEDPNEFVVKNCSFVGVQFDAAAVDAIRAIAEGLVENAKAAAENAKSLGALVSVLRASNVHIDAMLRVGGEG